MLYLEKYPYKVSSKIFYQETCLAGLATLNVKSRYSFLCLYLSSTILYKMMVWIWYICRIKKNRKYLIFNIQLNSISLSKLQNFNGKILENCWTEKLIKWEMPTTLITVMNRNKIYDNKKSKIRIIFEIKNLVFSFYIVVYTIVCL